jgi:hypothetical protein
LISEGSYAAPGGTRRRSMKWTFVATIGVLALAGCGSTQHTAAVRSTPPSPPQASTATASSASGTLTRTIRSGVPTSGARDPNVQVSSDGRTWIQAYEVPSRRSYSTIPGTGWDSITASGTSAPGSYQVRAFFNLPSNAVNASLIGFYYSDNQATVFVNGNDVGHDFRCGGSVESGDYGINGALSSTIIPPSAPLNHGVNTLSFVVNNCGSAASPTGIDFILNVMYTLAQ